MHTMSNVADNPDRTIEASDSVEDLLDLLAPGAPAAAPARHTAPLPAPRGPAVPGTGSAEPLRVGSRFQPLPSLPPIVAGDRDSGPGCALAAPAGTPVYAIEAGTVNLPGQAGEALRIMAESGLTFWYEGIAPDSVAVADGDRAAAGTILGAVAATVPPGRPYLTLRIVDTSGFDVDVQGFLVGLPDPNELGHPAVGTGVDVDPDALDLEITTDPSWKRAP